MRRWRGCTSLTGDPIDTASLYGSVMGLVGTLYGTFGRAEVSNVDDLARHGLGCGVAAVSGRAPRGDSLKPLDFWVGRRSKPNAFPLSFCDKNNSGGRGSNGRPIVVYCEAISS